MSIRTALRLAAVAATVAASACTPSRPRDDVVPTRPSVEPLEEVARFHTGFTVLDVTGVSCDGLRGPWHVRIEAPKPIQGSDRTTFLLPHERGPGRLRWSFQAQHPIGGTVTYSGNVHVRAAGTTEAPVLEFSGHQSSWNAEGPVAGTADVTLGGTCPA